MSIVVRAIIQANVRSLNCAALSSTIEPSAGWWSLDRGQIPVLLYRTGKAFHGRVAIRKFPFRWAGDDFTGVTLHLNGTTGSDYYVMI